jgi:hypothetical protein
MLIVNPGTEPRPGTEGNAVEACNRFLADLDLGARAVRNEPGDCEGYYSFRIVLAGAEPGSARGVTVDFPGSDPAVTQQGEPWVSPRIYVDGSSWLWGIGLDVATGHLTDRGDAGW